MSINSGDQDEAVRILSVKELFSTVAGNEIFPVDGLVAQFVNGSFLY